MIIQLLRAFILFFACVSLATAGQGRRFALVIGNGNYQQVELPKLNNPTHDAEDMASVLRGFGFEVIERKNLTHEAMSQAIAEFGSRIGGSEAALFYFAGHGIQVKNQNYLIPVNARIESEASVPYQGINLNQILDEMDNAKSYANIVLLDACRNNPISGKFRSGASRGLAGPGNTPKGTVIVYATDPGNVAADGDGRNGLFTSGLLTAFKGTDLSLDGVLTVASAEVERASGQAQSPYVNGPKTLQKNFHFRVTVDPGRAEIEKNFWLSIERSKDVADFEAYLRKYPNGSYRALAENQIVRLKAKLAEGTLMVKEIASLPQFTSKPPVSTVGDMEKAERARVEAEHISVSAREEVEPRHSKLFKDCADCPEMVVIPAGSFEMGSDFASNSEKPVHAVRIDKPFALARTEVTQGQWRAIMGNNPSYFTGCGDYCPVEKVNWNDAQDFVRKLSQKTGKLYRLPSEAEWEYACRAGGTHAYCGSDNIDVVAWYGAHATPAGNSQKMTNPVGRKQANAWGMYDMSGNVYEWTEDCWNESYSGAPSDGRERKDGECNRRVLRGGSWYNDAQGSRSTGRTRIDATIRYSNNGFRPARMLP